MDETFEFHHDRNKKRRKDRLKIKQIKERKFLGNNRSEIFDSSPKRQRTRNDKIRRILDDQEE